MEWYRDVQNSDEWNVVGMGVVGIERAGSAWARMGMVRIVIVNE